MSQVAGLAAVGLTSFAMYKNIKNFKANNPGVSGWKAFTTAPYASQMLASGLGCAAGVCLMSGNAPAAAICGGAALTVLGVSEYKNARKLGLSKWNSFKRSAHKLSAVAAGAFTGNWLSQQFGMTPDSIKQGEKQEDAKPGKEYHNYSKEEHSHADLRQGAAENHPNDPHTEGSRYSENLGHDWTESSYAQDPQNIHATMQSNINNGIQGHSQFFTLGDNGQEISNADVLEYKLYQLNILAQNGDVATVNGSPVSEVFSATDANGNVTTYQDLYHNLQQPGYQMTTSDLELLGKIENGVGGQIGDGVNDMGKISIFGEIANKDGQVLSYVNKMDAGYDVVHSGGQEAVYAPDEVIKGENPSSVAYIGWVGKAKKALQRVGALADKINPFKKTKDAEPLPPQLIPEDKMPENKIPEDKKEQSVEPIVILPNNSKQDEIKEQPKPQPQPAPQPRIQEEPEVKPQPEPQVQKDKLLMDEYKIVHGIEPSDKEYMRYECLVRREFNEDRKSGETGRTEFSDYLRDRQVDFENQIFSPGNKLVQSGVSTIEDRKELLSERQDATKAEKETRNDTINTTRQAIWQAKSVEERDADGKVKEVIGGSKEIIGGKEVKNMTLKDFKEAMKHGPAFRQDNQGNRHSAGSAYGPVISKRNEKGR